MSREVKIVLPHLWTARPYQYRLWKFLERGGTRAAVKWHRRAGKDTVALHWTTVAACTRRVGVYWHMLPTLRQGRKVIWENIAASGRRVLDAWPGWDTPGSPEGVVKHIRHDEMKIELHNGSIWYVVGSDNYDSVMGTNPVGIVMSEYALSDPKAWDYVRPILSENGGWAVFVWTPRGRNHASRLYDLASKHEQWFAETLTVDDTGAIPMSAIEDERRVGMAEELIQQEYWCSDDAPLVGAFWGDLLMAAEREQRIRPVHHDTSVKIDTWWDLGHSDATAIWWVQHVGNEIHFIDYYETNGQPLSHFAGVLEDKRRERGLVYGRHIWPHDGGAKTLASGGRPLSSMMADLGILVDVQPRADIMVGIQRVRQVLPRCWFDRDRCSLGLDALRAYRKDQDEERSTEDRPYFKPTPRHDWSSHGSDAFRTGCMAATDPYESRRDHRLRYQGKPVRPSPWAA